MDILVRAFSEEPVENLITAVHYRFDRVVYIGYEEAPEETENKKKAVVSFLKKYCGCKNADFHDISRTDLPDAVEKIRAAVLTEMQAGHRIYLDVTGGRGLVMTAFGMLESELKMPMHMYWITKDLLIEYSEDRTLRMSENVQPQDVEIDLDRFVEMRSGVINYRMHKEIKGIDNEEMEKLTDGIWALFTKYESCWTHLSGFFQKTAVDAELSASLDTSDVKAEFKKAKVLSLELLEQFLKDGKEAGVFRTVEAGKSEIRFRFSSATARNILTDAGSILELHTYQIMRALTPNCKVGVHLDWDGVIHSRAGRDVVNEIDVLALHGMVPTFISCKIGAADKNALYELSAVTARFGGKYAKMMLVTGKNLSETDLLRAKEMNIQVMTRDLEPQEAETKAQATP